MDMYLEQTLTSCRLTKGYLKDDFCVLKVPMAMALAWRLVEYCDSLFYCNSFTHEDHIHA